MATMSGEYVLNNINRLVFVTETDCALQGTNFIFIYNLDERRRLTNVFGDEP
jgi:hypothetical protein